MIIGVLYKMSDIDDDDDYDYGDDDFDDYEFEDFEDSEKDDDDVVGGTGSVVVENNNSDSNRDKEHELNNEEKDEVKRDNDKIENSHGINEHSSHVDVSDNSLVSTGVHNAEVIANLKLNEISEVTFPENTSNKEGESNVINETNKSGSDTLVQSISAELRQMMLEEERQNKENIQSVSFEKNVAETGKTKETKKKKIQKTGKQSSSPETYAALLPGEQGIIDNSSSLIDGGYVNNMSSLETTVTSPSKIVNGPGSEAWKSQLDCYSKALVKCIEKESKRKKVSRFIQSHVSHDSKHHRSIVERQLRCALQQVNSYRKENSYLTKMIDASTIHSDFNALKVKNEEQKMIIKQLTEEKRALLLVQRNQEKTLLKSEQEKESLPEKEYITQKKMNMFENKVKTLRDSLYKYQLKYREENAKNKKLSDQNTKLKVKLKAALIRLSVAEKTNLDKIGVVDDIDISKSCTTAFESLGVDNNDSTDKVESMTAAADENDNIRELRIQRNKLKSIVDHQRSSFRSQLVVLQSKFDASLVKRKQLEDELIRREREMKSQIFMVKELNKTCEELTKSNMELLEASSLYSKKTRRSITRPQSSSNPVPRPPAHTVTGTHRPSPVTARPKEPVMAQENENTFLTGFQNFD